MQILKKGKKSKQKIEINEKLISDLVDNKLFKFMFIVGVIIGLKIIFLQLLTITKKINSIEEDLFLYDELDYEDYEDLGYEELR